MKRRLRQRQILELLQHDPELSVDEACSRLEASQATIRREFALLAAEGKVEKTWGGIRAKDAGSPVSTGPAAFNKRLAESAAEKRAIAEAAAALLEDGDVVMIDGGTTTFQLCEFIALKRIRIITNSLVIAQEVDRRKGAQRGAEVYLTGGVLQPDSGLVAGPKTEQFLSGYHAKWCFFSSAGVDETSVTNYNETVLSSERLMLAQSERIVLLVDHTKLGQRAMSLLCSVKEIDHLFTTAGKEQQGLLKKLKQAGVTLHQVRI